LERKKTAPPSPAGIIEKQTERLYFVFVNKIYFFVNVHKMSDKWIITTFAHFLNVRKVRNIMEQATGSVV
jgi:hypothetical protein